jgi:hypothetical protein
MSLLKMGKLPGKLMLGRHVVKLYINSIYQILAYDKPSNSAEQKTVGQADNQ